LGSTLAMGFVAAVALPTVFLRALLSAVVSPFAVAGVDALASGFELHALAPARAIMARECSLGDMIN
jgi:hypothetical protein